MAPDNEISQQGRRDPNAPRAKAGMTAFRLTEDDRAKLKAEAAGLGLTLQQLFELRMLGEARPARRPGRRITAQDEELPIAV